MRPSLFDLDNIVRSDAPYILPFDENNLKLTKRLIELEKKYESQLQITPFDLNQLYQQTIKAYTTKNDSLIPASKIKYLPLLFFFSTYGSSVTANDEELIKYIIQQLSTRTSSRRTLSTAIHEYICNYNHTYRAINKIGLFIYNQLRDINICGKRLQKWKDLAFIFKEDGISQFVGKMFAENDLRAFFQKLDLTSAERWGGFVKTSISVYYKSPNVSNERKFLNLSGCFEYDSRYYTGCPFTNILAASANALIPWASGANNEIQGYLRQFYLQYLGDPRLVNAIKWHGVSVAAKKIFIQWLAKFDLETFFEIIEDTALDDGWEYRMRFWRAYLPYFENTWVALGSDARQLANRVRKRDEDAQYMKYASVRGSSSSQSIFIFEIRGYIFVEWSHSGKLRVWRKNDSPVTIGKMFYEATHIRSGITAYEKRHYPYANYAWQEDVRAWLLRNCGIAPQQSYRI